MINILLEGYEINADYLYDELKNYIKPEHKVVVVAFSFRDDRVKSIDDLFVDLDEWKKEHLILIEPVKTESSNEALEPEIVENMLVPRSEEEQQIKISDNSSEKQESKKKKGCYLATCVYGSYDCPEVWILRRFRDYKLAKSWYGRAFIYFYYAIAPFFVKHFGKAHWFKNMWRNFLDKKVEKLQNEGFESTPYNDEY